MNLPSNEYTFNFKTKGERTSRTFEGSFTVKCLLSNSEVIEVGLRLDSYNRGSNSLPEGVKLLNRAIAELEVRIVKAPSWWKDSNEGRDLQDRNVLYELFDKVFEAEKVYDERIAAAANAADEAAEKSAKKKSEKKE